MRRALGGPLARQVRTSVSSSLVETSRLRLLFPRCRTPRSRLQRHKTTDAACKSAAAVFCSRNESPLTVRTVGERMNKIDRRRPESEMEATVNSVRLGARLRLARQMRGMTLKALADAANCSESLLSKIENGKASPSLPMLHRLVEALGHQYRLDVRGCRRRRGHRVPRRHAPADRARSAAARRRHLARTRHPLFAGPSAPVQHPSYREGRRKRRADPACRRGGRLCACRTRSS